MKQKAFVPIEDDLVDRKAVIEVLRIIPFTHDLPVWHWRLAGQREARPVEQEANKNTDN